MMTIQHLGNKQTVITNNGKRYFFSYETLIAVLDLNNGILYKDANYYSKTTNNYFYKFYEQVKSITKEVKEITQKELQEL